MVAGTMQGVYSCLCLLYTGILKEQTPTYSTTPLQTRHCWDGVQLLRVSFWEMTLQVETNVPCAETVTCAKTVQNQSKATRWRSFTTSLPVFLPSTLTCCPPPPSLLGKASQLPQVAFKCLLSLPPPISTPNILVSFPFVDHLMERGILGTK